MTFHDNFNLFSIDSLQHGLRIHEFPIFWNTSAPNQLTIVDVQHNSLPKEVLEPEVAVNILWSILSANIVYSDDIRKFKGHELLGPVWPFYPRSY